MILELITVSTLLFSSFRDASAHAEVPAASPAHTRRIAPSAVADQPVTLEQYVRNYFKDTPILSEIARCESRFRHLDKNGRVLRGETTVEDLGIMQINEFYHEDTAKALGFNLHTLNGNLAYARWLYTKEGAAPWLSSSKCWQTSETLAKVDGEATAN